MTVGQPVAFSQETDPKPPPSEGSEGPQTSDPQEPPTAGPRRERTIDRPKPKEKAQRVYLERIVAQPMSHEGAPWLIRPNREDEESVLEASEQLGLKSGMTVCDLGCGNGFWTLPMAKAVGEQGKVFAVDIQRQMLQMLRVRSMKERITNIEPVLGTISNPNLPIEKIDLILLVDVYHEFSHPQTMLWHMRNSLRDSGVVALLEYREEDPTVPIKPLHKMSKRQIMKEYTANGFKLVREYNQLPWQHLMFFARDDSSLPEIDPKPSSQVLLDLQRSNVSPE
ncbi:MAG: class I SAM-dependent methyltransferase [Planctomycetota bacterium]